MRNNSQLRRSRVQAPEVLLAVARMREETFILALEVRARVRRGRRRRRRCGGRANHTIYWRIRFIAGSCCRGLRDGTPWSVLPTRWGFSWGSSGALRCNRFGRFQEIARAVKGNEMREGIGLATTELFRDDARDSIPGQYHRLIVSGNYFRRQKEYLWKPFTRNCYHSNCFRRQKELNPFTRNRYHRKRGIYPIKAHLLSCNSVSLAASIMGNGLPVQLPRKSSLSIDQNMIPPRSFSSTYIAFFRAIASSSYPTH